MRVVEVAEFYSPTGGGVRTYIDRKFDAARAAGHELFVIAPWPHDGFEPRPGGGVVQVACPTLPFDANYRMFWDAAPVHAKLDALKPDLVEASSPWRGAWIAAGWTGDAPRAMFVHAEPVAVYPQRWLAAWMRRAKIDRLFEGYWAYLRRLAARFDTVVAGAWLSARLEGQGVGPVTAVDLGVDRSAFSPALRDEALRGRMLAACGQPAHAKLVLGVGRFHAQKRWPMVIEAVTAAREAAPLGLVIVGDGMARADVERAAAGKPFVHLAGAIRERRPLATLMASADALAHGCESETFGLVTGEALASGLPLIAPDWGGSAEQADPAVSETYAAAQADSMAAAILRLFARDPAELRAAAMRKAAEVRTDSQHYAELFAHYEGVVARGGSA
jgi:alpha-1,6-mannosyltransferase